MTELQIEHRLSDVENRAKSNQHRLDDVERRQEELAELVQSVAAIAQRQTDMDADVREIKQDVKGLLAAPARRWGTVVTALITALVTLILKGVFV